MLLLGSFKNSENSVIMSLAFFFVFFFIFRLSTDCAVRSCVVKINNKVIWFSFHMVCYVFKNNIKN
jgi:hypothetical protein